MLTTSNLPKSQDLRMHWEIKFRLGELLAWTRRLFLADFGRGHAKS